MNHKIAPSVLAADFANIQRDVEMINNIRNVYKFSGKAFYDEKLVSESEFSAMITNK